MLGGMNILGKFLIFCLGVPIGIYIAFYIVIAGEDEKGIGRVAAFIEAPLFWISQTLYPPNSGGGGCWLLYASAFFFLGRFRWVVFVGRCYIKVQDFIPLIT